MKSIKTSLAGFIVMVLVFSGLFLTCEVGLGDSVDTKPPKVSVASPAVDSVISGTFSLQGEASDDTSLKSVSVSLAETTTGAVYGPFTANVDTATKGWSATINAKNAEGTYEIPDGMYQLTITATDNANRTSIATTVYQIDNHLPTVLVTSPLSYGTEKTTFYRTIDIKGEVYDGSTVAEVVVEILGADGAVLATTKADGTNTWSARFEYTAADTTLADEGVYGMNIFAKDMAGNVNSYYFHRSDIYPFLNVGSDGYVTFPSMNQIGKVDQDLSAATEQGLTKAELAALRHGKDATATIAYPDFIYRNIEPPKVQWLNFSDVDPAIAPSAKIVGTILPPSDGSSIVSSSITFEIAKIVDNVFVLQPTSRVKLTNVSSSYNFEVTPSDALGADIPVGKYSIRVTYKTAGGLTLPSSREFTVASDAPTLEETELTADDPIVLNQHTSPFYYSKSVQGSATLKGTSKTSAGDKAPITYVDSFDASFHDDVSVADDGSYIIAFTGSDGTHTITMTATLGAYSTKLTRVLVVDTAIPTITFLNPTLNLAPVVTTNSGNYVMSSVSGTSNDGTGSQVRDVYCLVDGPDSDYSTATAFSGWSHATGTINWTLPTIAIDTVASPTEGNKKMWVAAIDDAGNVGISSVNFIFDIDNPVANFSTSTPLTTVGGYGTTRTGFMLGGLANDSAVTPLKAASSATLSCTKDGVAFNLGASAALTLTGGTWTWNSTSSTTAITDGLYIFTLTVTDNAGKIATATKTVRVDATAPVLTVSVPLANAITDDSTYDVSGSVTELGSGMGTVSYILRRGGTTVQSGNMTLTGSNWDGTLTLPSEGTYILSLTPTDAIVNAGTTTNVTFNYDLAVPTVAETEVLSADKYVSGNFNFTANTTDTNAVKSLKVEYRLNTETANKLMWDRLVTTAPETFLVNITAPNNAAGGTFSALVDGGTYIYTITATDIAGREANLTRTVHIDKTAPTATFTQPMLPTWPSEYTGGYFRSLAQPTLRARGDLSEQAFASIKVAIDSTLPAAFTNDAVHSDVDNLWYYDINIAALSSGEHTFYLKAVDRAGNTMAAPGYAQRNFIVDKALPTLTETEVGPASTGYHANSNIVLKGVITDDVALSAASAPYGLNVTASRDNAGVITVPTSALTFSNIVTTAGRVTSVDWQCVITVIPADATGTYTATASVNDAAGQAAASVTRIVTIDATPPTISIDDASNLGLPGVYVTGTAYTLSGLKGDVGSTVKTIECYVGNKATAATVTAGEWQAVVVTGSPSWNKSLDLSALSEGTNYFHARAYDQAGNMTPVTASFKYDKTAPSLDSGTLTSETIVPTTAASYVLNGSVSDTNATAAPTLVLSGSYIDSNGLPGTLPAITHVAGATPWSHTLTAEGKYELIYTATDCVGRTTVLRRNVTIDRTGPVISIDDPLSNANITLTAGNYDFKATVKDGGVGVNTGTITYNLAAFTGGAYGAGTTGSITPVGITCNKTVAIGATEGKKRYRITALDTLGNSSTKDVEFFYDSAAPIITEVTNGVKLYATGNIPFGGVWTESNEIKTIKLKCVDSGGVQKFDIPVTYTGTSGTNIAWNYTVVPSTVIAGGLADGYYTFTVTATDIADRTCIVNRTVTLDTIDPVVTHTTVYPAWISDNTYSFGGTITETGSGVKKVEYTLNAGVSWKAANLTSPTASTFAWDADVPLSNGSNTLTVRATDNADRVSNIVLAAATKTFTADLSAPVINSITVPVGYSNASTAITANYSVSDSGGSGVQSVKFEYSSASVTATLSSVGTAAPYAGSIDLMSLFTTTIATGSSGSYPVTVTVTDGAATPHTTVSTAYVKIDKKDPVVSITGMSLVVGTNTINGSQTLTANASDENLDATSCQYHVATTVLTLANVKALAPAAWTDFTSNASTTTFDTTNSGANTWENATVYIWVRSSDTVGNLGYSSATYVVDQDSNRPTIKVANISASGDILKYGDSAQISGTVSDDDLTSSIVVGTFIASGVPITSTVGYTSNTIGGVTTTTSASGTTTYTLATGDWTYTPAVITDGEKTVYFYIVDNTGAVFYTHATHVAPYIQFKSGAAANNTVAITYKSDSNAPTIPSVGGLYGNTITVGTTEYPLTIGLCLGGPNRRYAKIVARSTDANGIKGMKLKITDSGNVSRYEATTLPEYGTPSGSFTATTDETVAEWTTDAIDLSGVATGALSVTVTSYDQSGLYGNNTFMFSLDNTAPSVTGISPLPTDEVTGSILVKGTSFDNGNAGVASLSWLVPTDTQRGFTDAALAALGTWQNTMTGTATLTSWEFAFNGTNSTTNPLLSRYNIDNTDGLTYFVSLDSDIYTMPLYFRITDAVGNVNVFKSYTIKHNPDGDKPVTKLSYPTPADYPSVDKQYVTLGGTIRVSGTATDNVSVNRVYVQIDWDGDNDFENDDRDDIVASTYYPTLVAYAGSSIGSGIATDDQPAWWGIRASETTGWSINLNANNELNATTDLHVTGYPGLRDVNIRACSVDNNNKAGAWSIPVKIRVDNLAPRVGSTTLKVNRYPDTMTLATLTEAASPDASYDYKADMYLMGSSQLYLVVSTEDDSAIISNGVLKNASTTLTVGTQYRAFAHDWGTTKGYVLYIPLDNADGAQTYKITANDVNGPAQMTYSLNVDNTAPTITNYEGNGSAIAPATPIQDSNYRYTLLSDVVDGGSGFKRALVYFYRDMNGGSAGENRRLYDPMKNYSASPADSLIGVRNASGALLAGITERTVAGVPMYGKTYTGTRTSASKFTYSNSGNGDISENIHIRVGGLIELGGVYRKITEKSGDTVTFDPATPDGNTTAFFPYAQVVDNTSAENVSWSGGAYALDSTDDGDGMPESIAKSGTTCTWRATLYSKYIPDGPITAVYLAFDDVGNVSSTTVTTTVQNNRPRLSKLYLGTDLNRDSRYSDGEFEVYDIANVEGSDQTSFDLTTDSYKTFSGSTASLSTRGAFKIKNTLAVVPEFIGGNNTINLVYSQDGSVVTFPNPTPVTGTVTTPVVKTGFTPGSNNTIMTAATQVYVFSNAAVTGNASYTNADDGINKAMAFTFWDSTDEMVSGTNSQWAILKVEDFTIDVTDGNNPNVVINPFFWKSKTDNSLYDAAAGNGQINGHIELPGDLPSATFASGNANELDLDPKVSGRIVLRGTAYDDQCLSSIWIHFDNFTPTNYLTTAINYGTAGVANVGGNNYYKVAQFDSSTGTWSAVASATMGSNGWAFTVSDMTSDGAYFNQNGHKVFWALSIDTSKITNAAAANVNARVIAVDHVTSTGNDSETTSGGTAGTDSTYNEPLYRMDVVPYIVKLTTALSSLKSNNPSVYDRTALGHYPVSSAQTNVVVTGFNLTGTQTNATVTNDTVTQTMAGRSSGAFTLTVNGVSTLNNSNGNNAKGGYAGAYTDSNYAYCYNRQPNGDNNYLLTDDVMLDVWEMKIGAIPLRGALTDPVMRINPANNIIGFAFINGPANFSMSSGLGYAAKTDAPTYPASAANSYETWQYNYADFSNVSFIYDSLGNAHGTVVGLDTEPTQTPAFGGTFTYVTSRWGIGNLTSTQDNYNIQNKLRMESIGVPASYYVKGAPVSTGTDPKGLLDTHRFRSPSIAVATHGTDTATYLAYYDDIQEQIRFRYGGVVLGTRGEFGQFTDDNENATGVDQSIFEADAVNFSLLAGTDNPLTVTFATTNTITSTVYHGLTVGTVVYFRSMSGTPSLPNEITNNTTPYYVVATPTNKTFRVSATSGGTAITFTSTGTNVVMRTQSSLNFDTGNAAGEYLALDVVKDTADTTATDTVVAVWYNGTDLMYSYKTNPCNDFNAGTGTGNGYWSGTKKIFSNAGEYCAIKVDAQNGIHIAAYDTSGADLRYAYLTAFDSTYNETTDSCVVDSYAISGTRITIDTLTDTIDLDGPGPGAPKNIEIPYISYYMPSTQKTKMAYLVKPQTLGDDINYKLKGTTNDAFTGNWEVTLIPTTNRVQDDRVNIGLWKRGDGYSTTTGLSGGTVGTWTGPATASGTCYGNGTKYPVVGYAIKNGTAGAIEIAQMK